MDISVIDRQKVMVIIRHHRPFDVQGLFSTILNTGIQSAEIALNTPGAFEMISEAAGLFGSRMLVGAGTVLGVDDVKRARDAGARFIVSPVLNREVVECSVREGLPVFPGVCTPTEMYEAAQAGASMVKLFPASHYGPSYIKTVKAPLPGIPVIAVGGVTAGNVKEYLDMGADAVAVGGGIVKPDMVEAGDYGSIRERLEEFLAAMGFSPR